MASLRPLLIVWSLLCIAGVSAYPSGAPTGVCTSMMPTGHSANPQNSPTPYWIDVDKTSVEHGETVTVTIQGPSLSQIRGILLQARTIDTSTIVGEFLNLDSDSDFKGIDCAGSNSAVTHTNRDDKSLPVTFTWRSPDSDQTIQFIATIVETKTVFWTNVVSRTVSVAACPVVQSITAAECAGTFLTNIGSDILSLYHKTLDVVTFCRQIDDLNKTLTECTNNLSEGCETVLSTAKELYRNASTEFCDCEVESICIIDPCDNSPPTCPGSEGAQCTTYKCGGCWAVWTDSNGDPVNCSTEACSLESQGAIYNCAVTFFESLGEVANEVVNGTDICGKMEDVLLSAFACVESHKDTCETDEVYMSTIESIQHSYKQYNETLCDGKVGEDCGLLPIQGCFARMPSEPGSVEESCMGFKKVFQCLDEYEERCAEVDLAEVFGEESASLITMAYELCTLSESCPDYSERLENLTKCLSDLEEPTVISLDSVCNYITPMTECIFAQLDCEILHQLMVPILNSLRDFAGLLNCEITLGNHNFQPLDTECNMDKMLECATPVFQALSLPVIERTTDLLQYIQQIGNFPIDLTQPLDDSVCNALSGTSPVDCYITEYNKCYSLFSMAIQPNQYVYTGSFDVSLMPNISTEIFGSALTQISPLISTLDETSAVLEIRCAEGCEDTISRVLSFGLCTVPSGFTENFDVEFYAIIKSIIDKYNGGIPYSESCGKIEAVKNCTEKHLVGCPYTENQIYSLLSEPAFYQVLELCNLQFSISIEDATLGCKNEEFAENLLMTVHSSCDARSLTMGSINYLDTEGICRQLDYHLKCIAEKSACCDIKQQTLVPKLHTAALLNEQMTCNIRVPNDGIKIVASDNCNYLEVLRCYLPLLRTVGIDSIQAVDKSILSVILTLKENFTKEDCLPKSEMNNIESCVMDKSSQCRFPPICDADQSESRYLPLDDLIGYKQILNMCEPACQNLPHTVQSCLTPSMSSRFLEVSSSDLTGSDVEEGCQSVNTLMQCVKMAVGKCNMEIMHARSLLAVNAPAFLRVVDICTLDVQFLDASAIVEETTSTVVIPSSTVVTIGAAGIKVETSVLIGAGLCYLLLKMWA